jgi:DNA polymerase-3 subunit epsilon
MLREIVLDTETTGLDPLNGDKIVEIGALELIDHIPTGREFHRYINPGRPMSPESIAITGITDAMLAGKPSFIEISADLVDFIGTGTLVIHNAEFDVKFLNAELSPYGYKPIKLADVVDTLQMARIKFPGSPATLDALCKRFEIDNSSRVLHGALLDAQLLAEVYIELLGGRQRGFSLDVEADETALAFVQEGERKARAPRHFPLSDADRAAHAAMLEKLKSPLWAQYLSETEAA